MSTLSWTGVMSSSSFISRSTPYASAPTGGRDRRAPRLKNGGASAQGIARCVLLARSPLAVNPTHGAW